MKSLCRSSSSSRSMVEGEKGNLSDFSKRLETNPETKAENTETVCWFLDTKASLLTLLKSLEK